MSSTPIVDTWFGNLALPPGFVLPVDVVEASPGFNKVTFPDGFWCYTHAELTEATLIYNEIMILQEYFRHGLSMADAACVLDVGANIGMFTLAAKLPAPQATVFAFEPIPETFESLRLNVRSHGCSDVHLCNTAIGSEDHAQLTFTIFPNMPGNSTIVPALKVDQKPALDQILGKERADRAYQTEARVVGVRTLSSLIREHGITGVDYLKIDVEGAELAVLQGLAETDWPIIRQVAVETHTAALRRQVVEYLTARGFHVERDLGLSSAVGVSDVYARRL